MSSWRGYGRETHREDRLLLEKLSGALRDTMLVREERQERSVCHGTTSPRDRFRSALTSFVRPLAPPANSSHLHDFFPALTRTTLN